MKDNWKKIFVSIYLSIFIGSLFADTVIGFIIGSLFGITGGPLGVLAGSFIFALLEFIIKLCHG